MNASVLKISKAGNPIRWITKEQATQLICNDKVLWSFGEDKLVIRGGINRSGTRTEMRLDPIIAVDSHAKHTITHIPLTNRYLYRRDKMCMYCGYKGPLHEMTRDHIIPKSRGGKCSWNNLTLSCRPCNQRKRDRTPEEASMMLLGVPYTPTIYEFLYLQNRNVLADQLNFLEKGFKKITLN